MNEMDQLIAFLYCFALKTADSVSLDDIGNVVNKTIEGNKLEELIREGIDDDVLITTFRGARYPVISAKLLSDFVKRYKV